jgi:cold shock CspA family protein
MIGYVEDTKRKSQGFVFIRGEDGVSRFAHCREFESPLVFDLTHEGQKVEFESIPGPADKGTGLRAAKIRHAQ